MRGGALPLVLAALLAAGCTAASSPRSTYPPIGVTPQPAGAVAETTMRQVISALGSRGVAATPADRPFRPPEGALFASAPRDVVHAQIGGEPDRGYVVVYEFPSGGEALAAARDQATYISTGPGRVQFPTDTRYVIRVADATAVFYAWSPSEAADGRAQTVADALATIGTEVAVPR